MAARRLVERVAGADVRNERRPGVAHEIRLMAEHCPFRQGEDPASDCRVADSGEEDR